MSLNDSLAAALSTVLNAENVGKNNCIIKPVSSIIKNCFNVMKDSGYVGSFTEINDGKGNMIQLELLGVINKCGVVKPRYSVRKDTFEKFEKRYLPAKDMGILVLSTPKGILTHLQAKKLGTGGRLLLYCY